jgi:hypothetical protein
VNAPGLAAIAYRDTTYAALRRALLTAPGDETNLNSWRPGPTGDLAVMMAEWWAYLGDILTFYNERIANEDYLRTATQAASIQGLIGILGYKPRPAVAATATLAALVQPGPGYGAPITLPAGFQVQSKPGPGQPPQTFELTRKTVIAAPDAVVATAPPQLLSPDPGTILLAGAVSSILGGDVLLLRPRNGSAPQLAPVTAVAIQAPAGGSRQTRLSVSMSVSPPGPAASYRLDRAGQSTGLWTLTGGAIDSTGTVVHLSGLVRTLKPGDGVMFSIYANGAAGAPAYTTVASLTDIIWDSSGAPPSKTSTSLFPHTQLTLADPVLAGVSPAAVTMLFGWSEVAQLLDQPVATWPSGGGSGPALLAGATPFGTVGEDGNVLIADATGAGIIAQGRVCGDPSTTLSVSNLANPPPALQTPLSVMFNLLEMTCGKTLPPETLGGGDPTIANQTFQLAKSPLTYVRQGAALAAQLTIRVNGQAWSEAPSLFGQPANALVYTLSQDSNAVTTVQFGDGVNGARLPAGSGNVVATYRIGGGAAAPPAGSLTVIASPVPGLRALRNPVAAGGGADADPPGQIQAYAPRSVLTFGRAVSALDFEAVAAVAAGGVRVGAGWAWDSGAQRGAVTIYVADDAEVLAAVAGAVAGSGDPNRPVSVVPATAVGVQLAFDLIFDPAFDGPTVRAAVVIALTDPAAGLFGAQRLGIGQSVFESQIAQACLSVTGCVAIESVVFERGDIGIEAGPVHRPPEGGWFDLETADVTPNPVAATHG